MRLRAIKFMDGHLHFLEVKNSEILIENTLHISTENVWLVAGRAGNLEKFGFEPKKVGKLAVRHLKPPEVSELCSWNFLFLELWAILWPKNSVCYESR